MKSTTEAGIGQAFLGCHGVGAVGEDSRAAGSGADAPPSCLTGAQTPVEGLWDCLRFTFPDGVSLDDVLLLMGAEGWVEQDRGALGYGRCLRRGHQALFFQGRDGMGTHVELTGKGCRELEAEEWFTGWDAFLTLVVRLGGKFSRSDVAFDDRAGLLDLREIARATLADEWCGRWKQASATEDVKRLNGQVVRGLKVTLGRRGSDAYLRIYDKAAEQQVEGHWVRVELELRNERATAAVLLFLQEGIGALKAVLRGYVEWKQIGTATRKERCAPAAWWVAFLDEVEKARLVVAPVVRSLQKSVDWLKRQVASTLAFVRLGKGLDAIEGLLDSGVSRLQPWQVRCLLEGGGAV